MTARVIRREFLAALAGAATWPLAARAQQGDRMRRIGALMGVAERDPEGKAWVSAFRTALQQSGWIEGRNLQIDFRWPAAEFAVWRYTMKNSFD